jgi:hypothetical protein
MMATYDISYLECSQWHPTEQATAPSRRKLMQRLRDNEAYSNTSMREVGKDKEGKPVYKIGGNLHGKFMVRLAS